MQIDIHYGAIYYLARLAGIEREEATSIAWSSQFVDDAVFSGIVYGGAEGYICAASAHRLFTDNFSAHARLVWIPFHFVPDGNVPEGTFLDRLRCAKNSSLAKDAVDEAIRERDPFRFGVALHAYADTWAHQGFSGVWSDSNLVHHVQRTNGEQSLWEAIKFTIGDFIAKVKRRTSNPLGHMLADVYPDLPFLKWRYRTTASGPYIERDNPTDYLDALRTIYGCMLAYRGIPSRPLPREAEEVVRRLIANRDQDPKRRLARWMDEMRAWDPPEYREEGWFEDALGKKWREDRCVQIHSNGEPFSATPYHRFCEAIRKHSDFIVCELKLKGIAVV